MLANEPKKPQAEDHPLLAPLHHPGRTGRKHCFAPIQDYDTQWPSVLGPHFVDSVQKYAQIVATKEDIRRWCKQVHRAGYYNTALMYQDGFYFDVEELCFRHTRFSDKIVLSTRPEDAKPHSNSSDGLKWHVQTKDASDNIQQRVAKNQVDQNR